MKKILTLVTLLILGINCNAQKKPEKIEYTKFRLKDYVGEPTNTDLIAVKSTKSDTLFLIDSDMGKNVEMIWKMDKKYKNKPVLIFLSYEDLKKKQKYYNK